MANFTIGGLTAAIAGDLVSGAQLEIENVGATASLRMTLAQLRTALLGTAFTATDDLTIRGVTASAMTVTSASLAASTPFAWAQTWNATGVAMTAVKLNVTDTASAAGSLLHDWQVGGVSKLSVDKTGAVVAASSLRAVNLGVGVAPAAGVSINVDNLTQSGGYSQGIYFANALIPTGTSYAYGVSMGFRTANSLALNTLYNFSILNVNLGAASTVGAQYGLYIGALTSATNNYAIYTAGTTPSQFGGVVTVPNLTANAVAVSGGAGTVNYGGTTAATVGAAGAAAAMPTPVGYIIINVAGTQMKLAYFNT